MSILTTISLLDGAAVSRDFVPVKVEPSLVTFREKSNLGNGSPQFGGEPVMTLGHRLPTTANGNFKATLKIRIPILDDSFSGPGVQEKYALSANCDVVIPSTALQSERNHLMALLTDAVSDAVISGLFKDMDIPV
jgi:hypothetical protein